MTPGLIAILVYIAAQLVIAWYVSRQVSDEDDYLVAGRSLGYALCSFSIFATWFGAETCVAAAAAAYEQGLAGGSGDPFGYALCLLLMGALFATALWKRKLSTFADLYGQRYGPTTERLFAIIIIPPSLLWAAAQMRALGQVLSASSEASFAITITFAAVVIILYTAVGGLKADAVTDLIQGGTLAIGITVLFAAVFWGDERVAWESIPGERLRLIDPAAPWLDTLERWSIPVLGSLFVAEIIARVAAARSAVVARTGALAGGMMFLAFGTMVALIGVAASVESPGMVDPEHVILVLAEQRLGPLWSVLFTGALAAAILSTVDSALLTAGSLLAHNLVIPLMPRLSGDARLKLNRASVVLFGVIAYILAMRADSVYGLIEESSAFGTAGVFVVTPIALFTRFGGPAAAITSLAAGFTAYVYGSHFAGWDYPYLTAVAAAAAGYLLPAMLGKRQVDGSPTPRNM